MERVVNGLEFSIKKGFQLIGVLNRQEFSSDRVINNLGLKLQAIDKYMIIVITASFGNSTSPSSLRDGEGKETLN